MTIEEVLETWSASDIEKVTDVQWLEHFKKYLIVTRPEIAQKPERKPSSKYEPPPKLDAKKQAALAMLAAEGGMDLDFLKYRKKKT